MNKEALIRYDRHIRLDKIGLQGQEKLSKAKVLVIGAGGLGCPVLQYLTAAGIGTIGIVDDDLVSLSNLQRQILYTISDIGSAKVECAHKRLSQLNNLIKINTYNSRIGTHNAIDILRPYDIIVDCTDNFSTRYLVNDACVLLNKPMVYGAIHTFEGQVSVFNWKEGATYRCLFPTPPAPGEVPSCNEVGVIGVLPGIIGSFQANEVIKCILELGTILSNKIFTLNTLNYEQHLFNFKKQNEHLDAPRSIEEFKEMDYVEYCNANDSTFLDAHNLSDVEIEYKDIKSILNDKNSFLVDIRNAHESPLLDRNDVNRNPMQDIIENPSILPMDKDIFIFCQSGRRSLDLVSKLLSEHDFKSIKSIKGGILKMIKE